MSRNRRGYYISLKEMRELCPSCAESMYAQGFVRVKIPVSAEGQFQIADIPEPLRKGLCDKFGAEEGFRSRCMESSLGDFDPQDQGAFCNALKQFCFSASTSEAATYQKKKRDEQGRKGYRADQAQDGTWTIFDVPIFAAHTDDRGEEPIDFDRAWLERALHCSQTRHSEGYLPPLHVDHHGAGADVAAAGKFRITRMGQIAHDGALAWALFADLIGVRPEVYERIRRGELSYRSVEILDVDKAEVDSLALLDSEVPFFRFPLLQINGENKAKAKRIATTPSTPALAFRAAGRAAALLFAFKEAPVTEPTAAPTAAPEVSNRMDNPVEDRMLALLEAMAEKMGIDLPEAEEEEPEADEMPEEPPAMSATGPVEVGLPASAALAASGATAANDVPYAVLTGQVAALQAKVEGQERSQRISRQALGLENNGFSPEQVRQYRATARKQGEAVALGFAQGLKLVGPQDPPPSWAGEITAEEPEPAEVSAYAAKGPDALSKARNLHRSWTRTQSDIPLKDYLATLMDPNEFMATARKRS